MYDVQLWCAGVGCDVGDSLFTCADLPPWYDRYGMGNYHMVWYGREATVPYCSSGTIQSNIVRYPAAGRHIIVCYGGRVAKVGRVW